MYLEDPKQARLCLRRSRCPQTCDMLAQDTASRRSCGHFCTQAVARGYCSVRGCRHNPVAATSVSAQKDVAFKAIFLRCVYTKHNSKPRCLGHRTRSQSKVSRAVQHLWLRRFFWCWNRNSGDTGGLVKEDWRELEWDKVTYLSLIGLRPWFLDWVGCNIFGPLLVSAL